MRPPVSAWFKTLGFLGSGATTCTSATALGSEGGATKSLCSSTPKASHAASAADCKVLEAGRGDEVDTASIGGEVHELAASSTKGRGGGFCFPLSRRQIWAGHGEVSTRGLFRREAEVEDEAAVCCGSVAISLGSRVNLRCLWSCDPAASAAAIA